MLQPFMRPCENALNISHAPGRHFLLESPLSTSSSETAVVSSTSSTATSDVYSAFGELIGQTLRRLDDHQRAETIQRKLLMIMYDEIERTKNDSIQFQNHNVSR